MFGVGGTAVALRRQQTSWRTVEAYHHALDVMGKLAAEHAGAPRPEKAADADHPYVRVVRDDDRPVGPPKPPTLRSWPRRVRQPAPPLEVATPGPNTRIVWAADDPPRPLVEPLAPVGRTVLHFDADGVVPAGPAPEETWADVPPGQPDRAAPSRRRRAGGAGRLRPRRRWSRFGRPHLPRSRRIALPRRAVLSWRALALATVVAIVVAAAVIVTDQSGHRRRPAPPRTVAAGPAARPVATTPAAATTSAAATTPPTPALLVTGSPGSSIYDVDASATIRVAASAPCWVELRLSGSTGPILYQGDLLAGQSRAVSGPAWVRLGNPTAVVVTVNGSSISPPGLIAGEPYDLQFA